MQPFDDEEGPSNHNEPVLDLGSVFGRSNRDADEDDDEVSALLERSVMQQHVRASQLGITHDQYGGAGTGMKRLDGFDSTQVDDSRRSLRTTHRAHPENAAATATAAAAAAVVVPGPVTTSVASQPQPQRPPQQHNATLQTRYHNPAMAVTTWVHSKQLFRQHIVQISAVAIVAGLLLLGTLSYNFARSGQLEFLILSIVFFGGIVLFGGLQMWLVNPTLTVPDIRTGHRHHYRHRRRHSRLHQTRRETQSGIRENLSMEDDTQAPWNELRHRRKMTTHTGSAGHTDAHVSLQHGDNSDSPSSNDCDLGCRVSGLTLLFLFACLCIVSIAYVFFALHINAPYRVDLASAVTQSEFLHAGTLRTKTRYSVAHTDYKRDKFSIALHVNVGTLDESDAEVGLAHMTQHVVLDGSRHHAHRHGVMDNLQEFGTTSMTAYTSHRSTVFKLVDIPFTVQRMRQVLSLLYEMVFWSLPMQTQVNTEVGVVHGEERLMNSTQSLMRRIVFCNHFGVTHPVCRRFPYSKFQIEAQEHGFHVDRIRAFLDKWYKPENMHIFLAGDFDVQQVRAALADIWAMPPTPPDWHAATAHGDAHIHTKNIPTEHADIPAAAPTLPFLVLPVNGVDGIDFNLVVTTAYDQAIHNLEHQRRSMLRRMFFGTLLNACKAKLMHIEDTVDIRVNVQNAYEFNHTMHSLHLKVNGHPERGAWRHYVTTLLTELRRLADFGPDLQVLQHFIDSARLVLEAKRSFSAYADNAELLNDMIGNHDPDFLYLDAELLFATHSPFLNRGFLHSAALFIRNEAEFMWQAVLNVCGLLNGDALHVHTSQHTSYSVADQLKPTVSGPSLSPTIFHRQAVASITVLTDAVHIQSPIDDLEQTKSSKSQPRSSGVRSSFMEPTHSEASYVHEREVMDMVRQVMGMQLLTSETSLVIPAESVFVEPHGWTMPWMDRDHTGDYVSAREQRRIAESNLIHDHVRFVLDRDSHALRSEMDGLPTSGTLVDLSRLVQWQHKEGMRRNSRKNTAQKQTQTQTQTTASARMRMNNPPFNPTLSSPGTPPSSTSASSSSSTSSVHGVDYELVESFPQTGVKRFRLANGLHVNLKQRLSGIDNLPCDAPGVTELEVVSLGGRGTQPPKLKGACELVNLDVAAGYTVEYWPEEADDSGSVEEVYFDAELAHQYFGGISSHVRMSCSKQYFALRVPLHSKCINYPRVANCDTTTMNYTPRLESVRLALAPVFDDASVDRAAAKFERMLFRARRRADPEGFMKWRAYWELQRPWMDSRLAEEEFIEALRKNMSHPDHTRSHSRPDSRAEVVSASDVRALNPFLIGMWVREQFTVDRMEVNVVGDFDETNLLRQLNLMLGTIPSRSAKRIGFDIYNPEHSKYFQLKLDQPDPVSGRNVDVSRMMLNSRMTYEGGWRISGKSAAAAAAASSISHTKPLMTNCTMPSLHPGRLHIGMAVLMNLDYSSVRGHQRALMTNVVFKQTILDKLRRDHGLVFDVDSTLFVSMLFRRYGYYQLGWVIGVDEHGNAHALQQAVDAIEQVLHSPVPFSKDVFDRAKRQTISRLQGELQESSAWLGILRGISLRPPVWQTQQMPMYRTLRDVAQTDVLGRLFPLQADDINAFFREHVSKAFRPRLTIVETVDLKQQHDKQVRHSVLGGGLCDWKG
jgi:predicted Zn-dependent peptidase